MVPGQPPGPLSLSLFIVSSVATQLGDAAGMALLVSCAMVLTCWLE